MKRLAIIGAGELGQQVLEIVRLQKRYKPIGFFDDFYTKESFNGVPFFGKVDEVERFYNEGQFDCLFLAIGYYHLGFKYELMQKFSAIPFATIMHPTVVIEKSAIIEEGVLLYAKVYIGPKSKVCKGVVVNVNSFLPHGNIIEECTFISVGVQIGGVTKIGKRCFIGLGATISDSLSVPDDTTIGAATVILESINEAGTYVGYPSYKINKDD